jgi:hypothetical protein
MGEPDLGSGRSVMETCMDIDIGISKAHRETIAKALSQVLADTYVLYFKTHAYHWNVTGALFRTLHKLFEEQFFACDEDRKLLLTTTFEQRLE